MPAIPMLSAGYLYKTLAPRPDWDAIPAHVKDIASISGCMSGPFDDYIGHWKHNGFWLFDSPELMQDIAARAGIDLSSMRLFYYEIFTHEFLEHTRTWVALDLSKFPANVRVPGQRWLFGFDVATYSQGNLAECSPLSCNGLSAQLAVNEHCLFSSFEAARTALNAGKFDNSEPGPFRILAVYEVPD